ncbi:methylmalonyl-CoA mutase family protein [Candidatus Nanopelagicales bacterium]|nr:methylmalonyl-CoA mutase family protein [Candidatus Nanopelagicales bacterium]
MRTYAGHSSASASNTLFRTNLEKGQTGLSVAFDLPTQTGYDPHSPMAAGEVGKVGVPIAHLGGESGIGQCHDVHRLRPFIHRHHETISAFIYPRPRAA